MLLRFNKMFWLWFNLYVTIYKLQNLHFTTYGLSATINNLQSVIPVFVFRPWLVRAIWLARRRQQRICPVMYRFLRLSRKLFSRLSLPERINKEADCYLLHQAARARSAHGLSRSHAKTWSTRWSFGQTPWFISLTVEGSNLLRWFRYEPRQVVRKQSSWLCHQEIHIKVAEKYT